MSALQDKYNICGVEFINGYFTCRAARYSLPKPGNGCCGGFQETVDGVEYNLPPCKHMTANGCGTNSLMCKVWVCDAVWEDVELRRNARPFFDAVVDAVEQIEKYGIPNGLRLSKEESFAATEPNDWSAYKTWFTLLDEDDAKTETLQLVEQNNLVPISIGAKQRNAVVTWGRWSIPSIGHRSVAKYMSEQSNMMGGGDVLIFLSHSYDGLESGKFKAGETKNPLSYESKVGYVEDMIFYYGDVVRTEAKTVYKAMDTLIGKYDNVLFVVGEDRLEEFQMLHKYYDDKFNLMIKSAGNRSDNGSLVEQASATKLRQAAVDGDYETFEKFAGTVGSVTKNMYEEVRMEMGCYE